MRFADLTDALAHSALSPTWHHRLARLTACSGASAIHVAVMHEPYLSLLLDGAKAIESRFSAKRIAPFAAAAPGDLLALKAQAGPVVGLAQVDEVACYELDAEILRRLRRDYAAALCAEDDDFWLARTSARYATLLHVSDTTRIDPLTVAKRDRRGWVRLDVRDAEQRLAA
jgi:hypothetical protein